MSLYSAIVEHAKERATERYHVSLNRAKYWALVKKIMRGESRCILRVSNSRTIQEVDEMIVVYSNRTHRIVTFLPPDCWEMRKNGQ